MVKRFFSFLCYIVMRKISIIKYLFQKKFGTEVRAEIIWT